MRFPVNKDLIEQVHEFVNRVEAELKEDNEATHTAAVRSFLDFSKFLLPDEYRVVKDAWGDLLRDPGNPLMTDGFLKAITRVQHRFIRGVLPKIS
jgi:hypothetical protein